MAAPATPGPNASRQQLISYYGYYVGQIKGKYEGTNAQYQGESWTQIYQALLAADPSASPKQVADSVLGLAAAQGTGAAIAQGATEGGNLTAEAAKGAATGFSELGFLQGLTSANLWIRVAKVAIGGVILIVGIAKLTGAEKGVVGKAVKAAPLL